MTYDQAQAIRSFIEKIPGWSARCFEMGSNMQQGTGHAVYASHEDGASTWFHDPVTQEQVTTQLSGVRERT